MDTRKFFIRPPIPQELAPLQEMAFNVWSCWDTDAQRLFHRLDPLQFRRINHNPVEQLYRLSQERLAELSHDKGFLHDLYQVYEKFKTYMCYQGGIDTPKGRVQFDQKNTIAYMCMEYGLHECIPSYSGGLAVLAGDHLKAASDVGLPLVSFGLLYRYGYFTQHITPDGLQVEEYKEHMWFLSPIREAKDSNGQTLLIQIPLKNKIVWAKIWKIEVGKVLLYLLDTNIHQNPPEIRKITNMLYDPDRTTRLEQEIVLGRGCIRAMHALGITPKVYHINEGHTAFLILERMLDLVKEKGVSLEEASHIIRNSTVFTTHTPVVEGNEHFPTDLVTPYIENEAHELGLTTDQFLSMGSIDNDKKMFWLPAFAMRHSKKANGVSKLHGEVSRSMWKSLFPTLHERQNPIESVTNGVHLQTWLSLQLTEIFDRNIGPDYVHDSESAEIWNRINEIPDAEIWNAHRRRKEQLISFVRRRIGEVMLQRGYCKHRVKDVQGILNPNYLTIGFARRFARYKRANLILTEPDRLAKILTNPKRPIQIVFAGKAHPADTAGKDLIRQIIDFIDKYELENQVVFIEDYDMNVARHLVQGVDIWLNTPVKPMEASGTSGMKAAINGGLNLSVLDGWWPEGYNGKNGWSISPGESSSLATVSQAYEVNQLYDLLENEIPELYYDRREGDLPVEWVGRMKNAIITAGLQFSMHRTVHEYINDYYMPLTQLQSTIAAESPSFYKDMIEHKRTIDGIWPHIQIRDYFSGLHGRVPTSGETVTIDCYAYVDNADPSLLAAWAFYCYGEKREEFRRIPLKLIEKYADGVAKFSGEAKLDGTGLQEMSVCITPSNPRFCELYPQYVLWKE